MDSKEKTKFRQSKEWKLFCKELKEEKGLYCECCGVNSKRLQVHHIKPESYTDLNPINFALLCHHCHQGISRLERIKQCNYFKYNQKWVELYLPFITPKS
mgnify:CR=1 FL=1